MYSSAIELRPDNAPAHSNKAAVLKDLGRVDEAVALYLKAMQLDPLFIDACSALTAPRLWIVVNEGRR